MNKFITLYATGLCLGYLPKAPGTFGSLLGVMLFFLTAGLPPVSYAIFLIAFIAFSIWTAGEAAKIFGEADPQRVVIDEVAGVLVAAAFHPWSWKVAIAAFILFRLFDIWKPFPIRAIDRKVHGGLGIVLDDVLAGVFANVVLCILFKYVIPA